MISSKVTDASLMGELRELRDEFNVLLASPNPLTASNFTDLGLKMASLNSMLGSFVTKRKKAQFEAEKAAWKACQEDELSAAKTDQIIRHSTSQVRLNFEEIERFHRDIWRLVNVIQSHAAALNNERNSG